MPTKDKTKNAIMLLREDHKKVKDLFDEFEDAVSPAKKLRIVKEVLAALKVHATIEEALFYPALRLQMEDEDGILEEADEEHHVAKILIAELEKMSGGEKHWEAKFMVLAENVRHHIKEEEGTMFKKARETNIDFALLGGEMSKLKKVLTTAGVPRDFEARMIESSGLRGDSPAMTAVRHAKVPLKQRAA